mmetsp:Transcript_24836/g.79716  ORF Transcript_24836/g.79716 Transcript_24836/m.79716 type:complete len:319 (-) Transcript_24836:711-1667(-)
MFPSLFQRRSMLRTEGGASASASASSSSSAPSSPMLQSASESAVSEPHPPSTQASSSLPPSEKWFELRSRRARRERGSAAASRLHAFLSTLQPDSRSERSAEAGSALARAAVAAPSRRTFAVRSRWASLPREAAREVAPDEVIRLPLRRRERKRQSPASARARASQAASPTPVKQSESDRIGVLGSTAATAAPPPSRSGLWSRSRAVSEAWPARAAAKSDAALPYTMFDERLRESSEPFERSARASVRTLHRSRWRTERRRRRQPRAVRRGSRRREAAPGRSSAPDDASSSSTPPPASRAAHSRPRAHGAPSAPSSDV